MTKPVRVRKVKLSSLYGKLAPPGPDERPPSPFPATITGGPNLGRVITDERCRCGALRSAHLDVGPCYGHGPCPVKHCEKFRWAANVLDGEPG